MAVLRGDDDSPVNPNTTFGSMYHWAMEQLRTYAGKRKDLRAKEAFVDFVKVNNNNVLHNQDYNQRDDLSL